jgi:hypothetical protein
MSRAAVLAWVISVTADLRLSQAKTLAALVASALRVGRVSLAALGRQLAGTADAKHRIKRAWRFCANDRVTVSDGMAGLIGRALRKRRKPLVVALDWVEVRAFHTLMAAAVVKGRALPLLWASYPEWELAKSQNNLEEGLLRLLRTLVPADVRVILLADRGFGRAELARLCQHLGFRYLIRIKPDVWVKGPRFTGKLLDYPVKKGVRHLLYGVQYRKEDPVTQNVVVRWKPGLPAKRDEAWFLMTDLGGGALRLTDLYGQRMTIEELFRDQKSKRNGFALRLTQVTKARRFDRLVLILALAYWLLTGVGLVARGRYRPGRWCAGNGDRQCSAFTIGRVLIARTRTAPETAFRAALRATSNAVPKWG